MFTILSAPLMLLCVATTALWLTSQFRADEFFREAWSESRQKYTHVNIFWENGRLGMSYKWDNVAAGATRRSGPLWHHYSPQPSGKFGSVWLRWFHFDDAGTYGAWGIGVRLWPLATLLAILPAARLSFAIRRSTRHRSGTCLVCVYDLRATPGRCPECGTVPTPGNSRIYSN